MRITSGNARGIELSAPKGDTTRPATDAARQAIFSSLGDSVINSNVLDIFAGTGSYGLEAISRGAASAMFFESDKRAFFALKTNISAVEKSVRAAGFSPSLKAMPVDCIKFFKMPPQQIFDFVFADPPYAMLLEKPSLERICTMFCEISAPNTIFILEAPAQFELPATFIKKSETQSANYLFTQIKRLGKSSKGKPSQIIFKITPQ